jgi:hypothetical protein
VWGFSAITAAVNAFKAVIHDGKSAEEALQKMKDEDSNKSI